MRFAPRLDVIAGSGVGRVMVLASLLIAAGILVLVITGWMSSGPCWRPVPVRGR